ncbi:hypothetical protein ACRALDRAFT_1082323 [Sodiomyces alcalophilus JCM 7366]|uniref:uncharacterized protein n=1 Tax=Sodiomyces alcalophilus JCM 7366 TaxID=591952 RepID=UPI0039B3B04C
MSPVRQRRALGRAATLGDLYDARRDDFLPLSLVRGEVPSSAVEVRPIPSRESHYSETDTYTERFNHMKVDPELAASVLANMVKTTGAGAYLTTKAYQGLSAMTTLYHTVTTQETKLFLPSKELAAVLDTEKLKNNTATHVLVGIAWGVQTIVASRQELMDKSHDSFSRSFLKSELTKLASFLDGTETAGASDTHQADDQPVALPNTTFTIYSDLFPDHDGTVLTSCASARDILQASMDQLAAASEGRGRPIMFSLLPIPLLGYIMPGNFPQQTVPLVENPSVLTDCIRLFDDWAATIRTLEDNCQDLYVSKAENHYVTAKQKLGFALATHNEFHTRFVKALSECRSGVASAEPFFALLREFDCSNSIAEVQVSEEPQDCKPSFETLFAELGGYHADKEAVDLAIKHEEEVFVLWYDETSESDEDAWDKNAGFVIDLLSSKTPAAVMACDCTGETSASRMPRVSHHKRGKLVKADVLYDEDELENKCLTQYDPSQLDSTEAPLPRDRRPVQIKCPGRRCKNSDPRDWWCSTCAQRLEYADGSIYCGCGRAPPQAFKFKCTSAEHGRNFLKYPPSMLNKHLSNLQEYKELNILILGETGVGKSTFINAFINYLLFDSLDEAMDDDELSYLVPCSFSMQYVDKDDIDAGFVQKDVKVGDSDDNEKDGTHGQSATQGTKVHRIAIGNQVLRLIDTPGIGDTRGVEQDQKNMENILATVGHHDNIHGILVLLKPNMSRLTLMFRFCVNELLTHLHRDAARNLVFGFTNTRQTNYMPGDSYKPLQTLIRGHKSIDIKLGRETVFCFDSESFRYLAARKEAGIEMGNVDDFRSSWHRSAIEARRLMARFDSLQPHATKNTLSINSVRQIVIGLTKPMADISSSIESTIRLAKDQVEELQDVQCRGEKLRSKLHYKKVDILVTRLDRPRTVCRNADCVEYKNIGNDELRPVYLSICHDGCSRGAALEVVGDSRLANCCVMCRLTQMCKRCGHHWQEHLHFQWEQEEVIVEQEDPSVQAQLQANVSDMELKRHAIESINKNMEKAKQHRQTLQDAAIRFGLFLKANSIAPYNDDMLAYLDELIKEQRQTVSKAKSDNLPGAANSEARLDALMRMRAEYEQRIRVLEQGMTSDGTTAVPDENDIEQLLEELYSMEQWGATLRQINTVAAAASNTSYQENNWKGRIQKNWSDLTTLTTSAISKASEWMGFGGGQPRPASRHPYDDGPGPSRCSASRSSHVFSLPDTPPRQAGAPHYDEQSRSHRGAVRGMTQGNGQWEQPTRGRQGPPHTSRVGTRDNTRRRSAYGDFNRSQSPGRRSYDIRHRSPRRRNYNR